MKKKNILREAGVLLVAAVMILSTVIVTADTDTPPVFNVASNHGPSYPASTSSVGSLSADDYISYNDGYTEDSLGLTMGGSITMAIELTDTELSGHRNKVVDDIRVSIGSDVEGDQPGISYEVWVLESSLPANPDDIYSLPSGNIVATGTSTTVVWHTIDVDNYNIPDTGSLFVGVNYLNTVSGEFPCGMDETTTTPDRGGIITYEGYGSWSYIGDIGWPAVWGLDVGVSSTQLEIDSITGGLGVSARVKNIGPITAENVLWEIQFDGGIIFSGGVTTGGPVNIPSATDQAINAIAFGFGGLILPLNIIISATADNADPVSVTVPAKLILIFVDI